MYTCMHKFTLVFININYLQNETSVCPTEHNIDIYNTYIPIDWYLKRM